MKLSLFRGLHKLQPFRPIARRFPPQWCYLADLTGIALALAVYPHSQRSVGPLKQLLGQRHDSRTVRRKSHTHLLYRRWQNHLEIAWENWAWRIDNFVRIEGAAHLTDVLRGGQGAVLLSGHYYGLDRLVDPILAQKGFALSRWAHPLESESIEERWGNGNFAKWEIIDFRGDHWHHTQMLLTARRHLTENRIVHMSVRGQPDGAPECLVKNHYQSFFLEPKGLLLLEMLNAPVVPCFTIPDHRGNVVVKIYPPVPPLKHLVMASFGSLYSKHLKDHPEFTRIWRRVMRGDPWW